jgi:hypothetical protein
MNHLQFLSYRVAFSGLPFGELQQILAEVEQDRSWTESCRRCWRRLREMAEKAELAGDVQSAVHRWASILVPAIFVSKRESFADARWRILPICGRFGVIRVLPARFASLTATLLLRDIFG